MGSLDLDIAKLSLDEQACMYALGLSSAAVLPMTVKAAIELDVLEILVKGCGGHSGNPVMTASDVTSHLKTNNPQAPEMLDRILRCLASYDVIRCEIEINAEGKMMRRYGPAPVCKWLTKNEDGVSMAALALMNHDKALMESWYYLKDAVLDGCIPFDKAYGMTQFEYNAKDQRFSRIFNEGMRNFSTIFTKKFLEMYNGFNGINTLVDVGGGVGATLNAVTSKYRRINGINFDLPHVIADAPPYPGVEHVGGNMFESIPTGQWRMQHIPGCSSSYTLEKKIAKFYHLHPGKYSASAPATGDAIIMKWITHDWSDEHCKTILSNCYKALPQNGKLILLDSILPENPDARGAFDGDLLMMAYNPGGKERTENEFRTLTEGAGFSGFKVTYVFADTCVIEVTK